MKKHLFILSALLCIAICACQEEPYLNVSPGSITFDQSGGTQTIKISANYAWSASATGGFSVSPSKGEGEGTVTVTAGPASSSDPVNGSVTISSEGLSSKVDITQAAKSMISVGSGFTAPAEGGTFTVDIQYNTDFKVTVDAAASGWLKFVQTKAMSSGKLEFTVAANDTPDERSGKVTVSDPTGKATPVEFVIKQEAEGVIEVGSVGTVSGEGDELEVDVKHNCNIKVTPSEDWVKYIGEENGKLKFTVDNNYCPERKATVTISDSNGKVAPATFEVTQTESRFRQGLMKIYNAMDGSNWTNAENWATNAPFNTWKGVSGNTNNGITIIFKDMQLKGEFPDCFDDFADLLVNFELNEFQAYWDNNWVIPKFINGTLPPSFANLTNLRALDIYETSLTSLPDYFSGMKELSNVNVQCNDYMTGPLPESLGNNDYFLNLILRSNCFTGTIPDSWAKHFDQILIENNCLDGIFPDFGEKNIIWIGRFEQKEGYGLDATGRSFNAVWNHPEAKDIVTGATIPVMDIIKGNKYTVMLNWATWCPFSQSLMPQVTRFYQKYHKDGLEIIAYYDDSEGHEDAPDPLETIIEKGYDKWYNIDTKALTWGENKANGMLARGETPYVSGIFDSEGTMLFCSDKGIRDPVEHRFGHTASTDLIPFLETLFGPLDDDEEYVSTDFSRDGEVATIQTHTVGNGIDIVFMGDGYTDKDIASGDYDRLMAAAADEFFAIEPYKSFRNRFNVYSVKAVSKNGKVGPGTSTALSCTFGNGTYVEGNLDKCYEYALKVPGITSKNNLLVSVLVNSSRSAGTAHYDISFQSAVAFSSSAGNDRDSFGHGIRHESGGHGFGFLDDEYVVSYSEAPQDYVNYRKDQWKKYGWWANVDFTNDPATIKWAKFLNDSRYKDEVGIYAGGSTYGYGVWKPTANSMMNENMEYFNAPSREAIYKRIMTLSGESYSWENFLSYDAVNRGSAAKTAAARPPLKAAANTKWQPGAPPVIHR